MKFIRILMVAALFIVLALAGCGNEKNGSLNVTATSSSANGITTIPVTVKYTSPNTTNLLGVTYDVVTTYNGFPYESYTDSFNNSGVTTYTYSFVQRSATSATDTTPDVFFFQASTGGFTSATNAFIPPIPFAAPPAPAALALNPTPLTLVGFSIGQKSNVLITGGTGPYTFLLSPSPNADVSASISGSTLIVQKDSATTPGAASIIVLDAAIPPSTATLAVTY